MANTPYSNYSPYKKTRQTSWYLDRLTPRIIPPLDNDVELTIREDYVNRPDLLAHDVYGNAKLWWVFSMRNPDVIKDPIYDLQAGITIFVTDKDTLFTILNS